MMRNFAVFLDRDGTINNEVDNLHRLVDLELLPKARDAIKLLNQSDIPTIVITNQPVVARGWLTEDGVREIHREIQRRLGERKARIDHFYYCPHHPEANLIEYRIVCDCRKPKTGLFIKAAQESKIDLSKSYVVGDQFRDIEAGKNIKAVTVAVECGKSDFRDSVPDYKVKNLYEAVHLILKREKLL